MAIPKAGATSSRRPNPTPRLRFSNAAVLDGAVILLLLVLSFLFIRNLGLVSDDFFLLVENLKLPLTKSADELHRPLRNIVLKFLGGALGVRQVWPYRLLVALSYTAVMTVLYQFTRRLGVGRAGAWSTVMVMTFYPRNQEVLFWFAAWQDLVAALGLLLACLLFLDYREGGRVGDLAGAAVAYVVALGFKETVVVLPALLLLLDLYRAPSVERLKKPLFWRAYLPFAGVLLLYVAYYISDSGLASLAGHRTGGIYGFRGVGSVVAAVLRTLINMALPFVMPAPLGLSSVRIAHLAIVIVSLLAILMLAQYTKTWSVLLLAAGWIVVNVLPTSTFASLLNADRYLFVLLIGPAILAGFIVNAFLRLRPGLKTSLVIWTVLGIYSSAGTFALMRYRKVWKRAAEEVSDVAARTIQASSRLSRGGEIDLVNQTTMLSPYVVSVFSNGLAGALRGNGLPSEFPILANFASSEVTQRTLVDLVQACRQPLQRDSESRIVLVTIDHRLVQVDSDCAGPLVDSDRVRHPKAWRLLAFGASP